MDNLKGATDYDIDQGDREVFADFRNGSLPKVIFKVRNLVDRNETIRERVKPLDKDHLNIL